MMYAHSGRRLPRAHQQRGVVLIVALIFLVLLTILALSASGRSLLQERMAGGLRNTSLADMAAETTLRGVEWKLWTSTTKLTSTPLLWPAAGNARANSGASSGAHSIMQFFARRMRSGTHDANMI